MTAPDEAVVLAAGAGARCWPLTATRPKPLLPVGDETLLGRLLRGVAEAGLASATVVAAEAGGPVAGNARRAGQRLGLDVSLAVQDEPRGTGDALQSAAPLEGPALVLNGDVVLPEGSLDALLDGPAPAIGAAPVDDVSGYGALEATGDRLTGLREKPRGRREGLANAGVYLLDGDALARLDALRESERGEVELTDAVRGVLDEGRAIRVHRLEAWSEVGWPWDLLEANRQVLEELEPAREGRVADAAHLEGPVRVEEGARVRRGAVVEGPALVRSGATVGPNAYVRGATTLGPDAKVGHGCEVKNSVLLAGAQVPHVSYVGDSVLGADANLGAGTQVANLKHAGDAVRSRTPRGIADTGRRKFGVALGDGAKTGINATLNVGVLLGPGATVKPGETVLRSRLPGDS